MFARNETKLIEKAQACEERKELCQFENGLLGSLDKTIYQERGFTFFPSGSSYRNLLHYGQLIGADDFYRYDFGPERNMQKYNQTTPPAYNLSAIYGVPIAIFGGLQDTIVNPLDLEWLNEQLGDNVIVYKQFEGMTHLTFVIGKDMSFMQTDLIPILKGAQPGIQIVV